MEDSKHMHVIGINGSARKNGNTALLIQTVFHELEETGITTELIHLADANLSGCAGCFACAGKKTCVRCDDAFAEIFSSMCSADGIILGSPVYSADISAKMKAYLERAGVVAASNPGLLRHKAAASVAAVRRGGGLHAVDTMNHFFLNKEVYLVGSTYWNMVYGKDAGDVLDDAEGMANMKNLGKNMAQLLWKLC
ncbi:MAG: flavodoxin family protein [Methanocorpusculum sp.]|nr:flavodoxin family protein [Methanocorpusculum sp.]